MYYTRTSCNGYIVIGHCLYIQLACVKCNRRNSFNARLVIYMRVHTVRGGLGKYFMLVFNSKYSLALINLSSLEYPEGKTYRFINCFLI